MADRRRVMPIRGLTAERVEGRRFPWLVGGVLQESDAEFAAHFVDADLVTAVLDAADALERLRDKWRDDPCIDADADLANAELTLDVAVRALRAARPEDDT